MEQSPALTTPKDSLITLTHVIYGLHAFSAITGLFSSVFIVTAFLTGWPSIIAVILNYVKRDAAYGTYLASHFRWQISTFWFALLWVIVMILLTLTVFAIPLPWVLGVIPLAWVLGVVIGLWVLYRIARGWLRLADAQPVSS